MLVGWFVYKQNPILIPLKITYLKLVLVNEARGLEPHRLSLHLAHSPQSSLQGTSREPQGTEEGSLDITEQKSLVKTPMWITVIDTDGLT